MGIRIRKTLHEDKSTAVAQPVSSGAVPSIELRHVALVSLAGGNARNLEIINKWKQLLEFVKDANILRGNAATAYLAITLGDTKAETQILPLVTDYVDGMIGLQISGALRGDGGCLDVEFHSAIQELIEYAIENEKVDL